MVDNSDEGFLILWHSAKPASELKPGDEVVVVPVPPMVTVESQAIPYVIGGADDERD